VQPDASPDGGVERLVFGARVLGSVLSVLRQSLGAIFVGFGRAFLPHGISSFVSYVGFSCSFFSLLRLIIALRREPERIAHG
jgi:hypothetical protein